MSEDEHRGVGMPHNRLNYHGQIGMKVQNCIQSKNQIVVKSLLNCLDFTAFSFQPP